MFYSLCRVSPDGVSVRWGCDTILACLVVSDEVVEEEVVHVHEVRRHVVKTDRVRAHCTDTLKCRQ